MECPFNDGWTIADIELAIQRDLPDELLWVPVLISMDPPECDWSEATCVRLSSHPHFNVRGNAILGFGHLARTCGHLDKDTVGPILEAALSDSNDFVRGQAHAAADDVAQFLKWKEFDFNDD